MWVGLRCHWLQNVGKFEIVVFVGQKYKFHIDNFLEITDLKKMHQCEMYHEERKTFNFKLIGRSAID